MIHIEVVSSPDNRVIYPFTFYKNQILIGKTQGDICINDPSLNKTHMMLEIVDEQLFLHPMKDTAYFLLNNKRSTTIKKIKTNDTFTIGNTLIKIINFSINPKISKKNILNLSLDRLIEENSPKLNLIENLSKLMK